MPNTKILLLGILPVPDPFDKIVKATNVLISKFNDDKHVFYLDMSNSFLDSYRNQKEDLFDDTVHLSSLGYQVWYETMESFLQKLLK
jgi:lysophospholipase L1-like esterase